MVPPSLRQHRFGPTYTYHLVRNISIVLVLTKITWNQRTRLQMLTLTPIVSGSVPASLAHSSKM